MSTPLCAVSPGPVSSANVTPRPAMPHRDDQPSRLTRRALLAGASALGAGAIVTDGGSASARATARVAPFYGGHQAGIATPRPGNVVLAGCDLRTPNRGRVGALLRTWTSAIATLTAGRPTDPADSGETTGQPVAGLTVTIGFGPSLFDGRFGLAARRPAALTPLPTLSGDAIDERSSGGDLVIQACAEELVVATHAVRQLLRLAGTTAGLRWLITGFAPSTANGEPTRNPLGFIDGTANPAVGSNAFATTVWVPPVSDQRWLVNGTFLCFRRIRIDLAAWDALSVADQQVVIGREKRSGAPLSGGSLKSPVNLSAHTPTGALAIPPDSHVRLATPQENRGATLFRRSFAYERGADPPHGKLDAGLLFLTWVANPAIQFVPILTALNSHDRLGQFTTHTASGIWAVPPAPSRYSWLGEELLSGR